MEMKTISVNPEAGSARHLCKIWQHIYKSLVFKFIAGVKVKEKIEFNSLSHVL